MASNLLAIGTANIMVIEVDNQFDRGTVVVSGFDLYINSHLLTYLVRFGWQPVEVSN